MNMQECRTLRGKDAVVAISTRLPQLLAGVSIERAQIIADQWSTAIQTGQADLMISVALLQCQNQREPIAQNKSATSDVSGNGNSTPTDARLMGAAVAIHEKATNSATLLFVATDGEAGSAVVRLMRETLDQEMSNRGIAFVQWATDAVSIDAASGDPPEEQPEGMIRPRDLPAAMGFGLLGTLQYMAVSPSQAPNTHSLLDATGEPHRFSLRALDWEGEHAAFTNLVEQTYEGSLDCPGFTDYREAKDLLESYRATAHVCTDGWMWVCEDDHPKGVLIMGLHGDATEKASQATRGESGEDASAPVAELTYMGLVPSERGRGGGAELLRRAWQWARDQGCERMILAVDVQNSPAHSIYEAHGFSPILRETVWGRNI